MGFATEPCSGGNLVSSAPIHGLSIHFVSSVGYSSWSCFVKFADAFTIFVALSACAT